MLKNNNTEKTWRHNSDNLKKTCTFALAYKRSENGAIAQLVEHRTENPCVPGSIPGGTTSSFHPPPCQSPLCAGATFFMRWEYVKACLRGQ